MRRAGFGSVDYPGPHAITRRPVHEGLCMRSPMATDPIVKPPPSDAWVQETYWPPVIDHLRLQDQSKPTGADGERARIKERSRGPPEEESMPPPVRRLPSSPHPPPVLLARSSLRLGPSLGEQRRGVAVMASFDSRVAQIASAIRVIPDFPKPGAPLLHR
jgi:hypothetical protein